MSLAARCMQLSTPLRRLLALALVPIFAALLWDLTAAPALQLRASQQAWRTEARRLLAYSKGAVAARVELEQQLAALQASPLWSRFYRSPRAGASVATLQADVAQLLASVAGSAQSLAPLPSTDAGGLRRVGVRLTASVRIDQLQRFLAAVSSHARYLRIDQLIVTAPQQQSATENPLLAVEMDVHGFELPHARGQRP